MRSKIALSGLLYVYVNTYTCREFNGRSHERKHEHNFSSITKLLPSIIFRESGCSIQEWFTNSIRYWDKYIFPFLKYHAHNGSLYLGKSVIHLISKLHLFSDASNKGYGQCSYLRLTYDQYKIHCSFVIGKSRVTPLKTVTIPRLELSAAVISVRVSTQLGKELRLENVEEIFWTDSKVILGYISNESQRFHVHVANCVQEIHDKSSPKQRKYVETKLNPADEGLRSVCAWEIMNSKWICGPEFLWKSEDQWPDTMRTQEDVLCEPREQDPEVKGSITMVTVSTPEVPLYLTEHIKYFLDWFRAKRSVALCLRYLRKLKKRSQERRRSSGDENPVTHRKEVGSESYVPITVEELQSAEAVIIRPPRQPVSRKKLISCQRKKSSQRTSIKPFQRVNGPQTLRSLIHS